MSNAAKGNPQGLVGTTMGDTYALDKLLGKSPHGALYEARHNRLGQRCAVRVISAESSATRDALIGALSQHSAVIHPHLSPPRDLIMLDGNQIGVASALLPGQDLNQRIAAHGKLTLAEGTALLRQAAAALHALHQRNLVHGNLTPNNVFFCRYDDVALDGVLGDGKGSQTVMLVDMGLGLASASSSATAADDQRALGRMMMSFVSDLSPAQKQVLERTQDLKPEARYPSIVELWKAFDGAKRGAGEGKNSQASATATTVVPAIKLNKRDIAEAAGAGGRRAYVIMTAVLLALCGIVGFVLIRRGGQKSPTETKPAAVAAADTRVEEVTLRFEVTPAGAHARIQVDGKTADGGSLKIARRETSVLVSATAEGFAPFESKIIPAEDRTVEIALVPAKEDTASTEAPEGTKKGKKGGKKKPKK